MTETKLLQIRIKLEALVTEREGMIAENKQRRHHGESMAYPQQNFTINQTMIESLLKEFEAEPRKQVQIALDQTPYEAWRVFDNSGRVLCTAQDKAAAEAFCRGNGWEVIE